MWGITRITSNSTTFIYPLLPFCARCRQSCTCPERLWKSTGMIWSTICRMHLNIFSQTIPTSGYSFLRYVFLCVLVSLFHTFCLHFDHRCFFIHLGVATQLHPYALQSYFRHTAAAERSIEGRFDVPYLFYCLLSVRCFSKLFLIIIFLKQFPECVFSLFFKLFYLADWQVELAKSIGEYAGLIDANVLQYTWPENFDKYRILLVRFWHFICLCFLFFYSFFLKACGSYSMSELLLTHAKILFSCFLHCL